jgi:tRNA nucleotidyltransferase/poly(A) polymerase
LKISTKFIFRCSVIKVLIDNQQKICYINTMNLKPINLFNFPTFFVGGFVRDHFLCVKSKDVDLVMVAPDFDTMVAEIERVGGEIFQARPEFLVARAMVPGFGAVDFALPRSDGEYNDGRHPESTDIADSIETDLSRRDFTMNAVAVNVKTLEVVDPFLGKFDALDGVISFVGKAKDRLNEDALRGFRAVRFAVVKRMGMQSSTREAVASMVASDFSGVSTERIRDEVGKMFAKNTSAAIGTLFQDFPVLGDLMLDRGIWLKPTSEKALQNRHVGDKGPRAPTEHLVV